MGRSVIFYGPARLVLCVLLSVSFASACHRPQPLPEMAGGKLTLRDHTFEEDRTLEGVLYVSGDCLVPRGVTLKILPGTRVLFIPRDDDGDGLGDSRLRIEGRLLALGSAEEPIIFTSAGDREGQRRIGDWDSLLFNFSRENLLRYAVIEYSNYSIHAHFSGGRVWRCLITRNNDGSRMGNCSFSIEENLVIDNINKGLNFRACANIVRKNEIRANGNGIFIFEKDSGTIISGNNIYGNRRYNLRLGDFFTGRLFLENNWWGDGDEKKIRKTIYDSRFDENIGTVSLKPAAKPHDILSGLHFPFEGFEVPRP